MSAEVGRTSGAGRAEQARRKAAELGAEAKKWERLAANYEKGDIGERETARLLDILDGAGWIILNDRYKSARSPANIDHIAVGPPGVCVIDTKNWAGTVAVDTQGLLANGRRHDATLVEARAAADIVAAVARDTVPDTITAPVLCFAGTPGLASPVFEHGVVVLQQDQLLHWLTSWPRVLSEQEVQRLGGALGAHFWPRTERRSALSFPSAPSRPRRSSARTFAPRASGAGKSAPRPRRLRLTPTPARRPSAQLKRQRAARPDDGTWGLRGRLIALAVIALVAFVPPVRSAIGQGYLTGSGWLADKLSEGLKEGLTPRPTPKPTPPSSSR